MGGNAFGDLNVVRIPNATYFRLSESLKGLLKDHFRQVILPLPSPGKSDHGDVDYLVEGPFHPTSAKIIARLLKAEIWAGSWGKEQGAGLASGTVNFAVPVSADDRQEIQTASPPEEQVYYQVDVHICKPDMIEWEAFTKAYGDLWNIIGAMLRRHGITVNDTGFHVRVPEIELHDKKRSRVWLTKVPSAVMDFLGYDYDQFLRGWNDVDEMFRWIASTRFFSTEPFQVDDLGLMDHQERRRMTLRPVYNRWATDFVPSIKGQVGEPTITRDSTLEEALERFDARGTYEERLADWRKERGLHDLWQKVGSVIPATTKVKRNQVVRGVKKRVCVEREDREPGKISFVNEDGKVAEEQLLDWVKENWESIKADERARIKQEQDMRKASTVASTAQGSILT